MANPLTLTLIIPAYNEQRHLKACLKSIAKQTIKPLEVIVVNNNSTDKTAQIAKSFKFVRVVNVKRQGVVYARNRGFNQAKGSIIGRIDADSLLPSNWVETVLDFYNEPMNATTAFTGGCYFYNVRLRRFSSWFQSSLAFRMNRILLGHYILYGSNMALPKYMWNEVKSHTCMRTDVHEDLDLAIHSHKQGYKIVYDSSFKVGVKMRRVRSNHKELWENLYLWPQTLRIHGLQTWIFGWIGAVFLYAMSPLIVVWEKVAIFFWKKPLPE